MSDTRVGQLLAAIIRHKRNREEMAEIDPDKHSVNASDLQLWDVLDPGPEYETPLAKPEYYELIEEGVGLLRQIRNSMRRAEDPPG